MKEAKEIYKALEEAYDLIKEAGRICTDAGADIEAVNLLMDTKEEASTAKARGAIDYAISQISGIAVEKMEDMDSNIARAGTVAEDGLEEPEAEKGHRPTEEELRDIHRVSNELHDYLVMEMENKQEILSKMLPAIRATRAGVDVAKITDNRNGSATIYFTTGARKAVNIEGDSGIAMIVDICRALM